VASTLAVQKDKVRMMVADIGYTETAQRLNIKRDTLYQWAKRYGWNTPITHSQETVRTVRPVEVEHANVIAELKGQTKLSLAKASARMAKDCETLPVRHAKLAHTVAQTYAITHEIGQDKSAQANVMVNIALLGIQPEDIRCDASQPQELLEGQETGEAS
jgi:hypothetical protein